MSQSTTSIPTHLLNTARGGDTTTLTGSNLEFEGDSGQNLKSECVNLIIITQVLVALLKITVYQNTNVFISVIKEDCILFRLLNKISKNKGELENWIILLLIISSKLIGIKK